MKTLRKLKLAVVPMILLTLLISCTTVQKSENKNNVDVLLVFPNFPDPLDEEGIPIVSFVQESESVLMPLWYWKKITRYVLYVDEAESIYNAHYNIESIED